MNTSKDLAAKISSELGIPYKEVQKVINVLFKKIRVSLHKGETVYWAGFGTFQ